jgi:hydroxyacylglutathione hydrolase
LIVKQIPVGTMANFVYLIVEEKTREAMVIDSGWETGPIEKAAAEAAADVKFAVATHEHFDHVTTLDEVARKLGAKVVAHRSSPIRCDLKVADGDVLKLGAEEVRVIYTPGHTEDSICLHDGGHVFTGDTLFVGTIGRFEREKAEEIFTSLHDILKLPPSTVLFPGHDYGEVPSRTLAEERASNPFLRAASLREFLALSS